MDSFGAETIGELLQTWCRIFGFHKTRNCLDWL